MYLTYKKAKSDGLWKFEHYSLNGVLLTGKSGRKNPAVVPRIQSQDERRSDGRLSSMIDDRYNWFWQLSCSATTEII